MKSRPWVWLLLPALVLPSACSRSPSSDRPTQEPVASRSPTSRDATAGDWMVICGVVTSEESSAGPLKILSTVVGTKASIVDTNDYPGLTPNLRVMSAGLYSSKEEAGAVVDQLKGQGLSCYAKTATQATENAFGQSGGATKAADTKAMAFVGTGGNLWMCLEPGKEALPYDTCRSRLVKGSKLFRPTTLPDGIVQGVSGPALSALQGEWVEVGTINKEVSEEPCGEIASFDVARILAPTKAIPMVAVNDPQRLLSEIRPKLEKRFSLKFPRLLIRSLLEVDLDGDGTQEILVDVAHGLNDQNEVTGNILQYVGIIKGEGDQRTLIDVMEHHASRQAASDYYVAHIFGYLAAVSDVEGDGLPEILVQTGYHEGGGLEVYALRGGQVLKRGMNGCGA